MRILRNLKCRKLDLAESKLGPRFLDLELDLCLASDVVYRYMRTYLYEQMLNVGNLK